MVVSTVKTVATITVSSPPALNDHVRDEADIRTVHDLFIPNYLKATIGEIASKSGEFLFTPKIHLSLLTVLYLTLS